MDSKIDITYKILLLGESNVGKTSIILRYIENSFVESDTSTVGVDVKYKYVTCEDKKIRLDIWDTAGQERFRGIAKNYFQKGHGFILVYDITNKESFNKLKIWINDAKEHFENENDYRMIVVGNKKDCEKKREVSIEMLKKFGEDNKILYTEVSAKTGEGVDKLFSDFVHELIKYRNIGIYRVDEPADRTYSSLDRSIAKDNKQNCNC